MNERKPTLAEYTELWMAAVMRHLPVEWASAIGAYFGAREGRKAIAARCKWIDRLHTNIERFSGVTDPAERERRIIEHTRRIGRIYAEFTVLQRIVKEGRLEVIGSEHLQGLSKPVIIAGGHVSNWELLSHATTLIGGAFYGLYLPPENPIRHRLVVKARSSWPHAPESKLVPTTPHAMRQMAKALAQGYSLVMLVDEERDGYVWAPSLGRRIPYAGNRWLTARLAVRYNTDIIPIHVETTGNARYRMIIEPKLTPGEGDDETRARSLADQMDRHLDTWVRAQPEHWYWFNMLDMDRPPPVHTEK